MTTTNHISAPERQPVPPLLPEDAAYIESIRIQLNSDAQFRFNTLIALLAETAEHALNNAKPTKTLLRNNSEIFFRNFSDDLDTLLRLHKVEMSSKDRASRNGASTTTIAIRIENIFRSLVGYKIRESSNKPALPSH